MRCISCVCIAAAFSWCSPVNAASVESGSGLSLYHLPGVTTDQARGDLFYCLDLAGLAKSNRTVLAGSQSYGLVGSLINGLWGGKDDKRMSAAIVDRCMLAHGYRVYRVDKVQWEQLLTLPDDVKINPAKIDNRIVDALAQFAASALPDSVSAPK